MKTITIYQKDASDVVIIDDSKDPIDNYCQELSKLFQMTNVTILKTSTATFIGRPSQLSGIVVTEDEKQQEVKLEEPVSDTPEKVVEEEKKEEIQEDIITDID
jgi:hypothetical protein